VALYKRKRWVSWFLCTFLVISYAIAAVLIVVSLRQYGGKSSIPTLCPSPLTLRNRVDWILARISCLRILNPPAFHDSNFLRPLRI
jgi:hypothetical protein